jgi:hypothetical protein
MNSLTISFISETAVDYLTSLNLDPTVNKATDKNRPTFTSTLTLAQQVRNPFTCINLAVDLLESAVKFNDYKIYLERGSTRIDN